MWPHRLHTMVILKKQKPLMDIKSGLRSGKDLVESSHKQKAVKRSASLLCVDTISLCDTIKEEVITLGGDLVPLQRQKQPMKRDQER